MSGAPAPRTNPLLLGHEPAERTLRELFETSRLPHALLLCGPRGIGKATLAFRFARFVLARSSTEAALLPAPKAGASLAIPEESGVFRRVAAGGHADLLTVERAYDPKRRRMRSEIVVEDARQIAEFLRLTPAEGGWRIVIVDGADEMNRNAANALLKIVEEPPRRVLLLVVAHSPGRLLPTIRSRCQRLSLAPLPTPIVRQLLRRYRPDLADGEAEALALLAEGSIGRAVELADAGGLELYRSLLALAARVDPTALHALADRLTRPNTEDAYAMAADLLAQILGRAAVIGAGAGSEDAAGEGEALRQLSRRAPPARWAALREEVTQTFSRTDDLNLDRKQAIMGAFFAIAEAAG
ncbi:MAG TPA: DNA polymerase III subunit delta' [Stellaceae bacterium]|nr:DNA polymerase III subunit delta' [Stellaceae bacterium]